MDVVCTLGSCFESSPATPGRKPLGPKKGGGIEWVILTSQCRGLLPYVLCTPGGKRSGEPFYSRGRQSISQSEDHWNPTASRTDAVNLHDPYCQVVTQSPSLSLTQPSHQQAPMLSSWTKCSSLTIPQTSTHQATPDTHAVNQRSFYRGCVPHPQRLRTRPIKVCMASHSKASAGDLPHLYHGWVRQR